MEQLHGVAERVNSLLDTVEEPIRAFVPQVTKAVNAADAMVEQLSGPIDRVAPGLVRLADVLSSPQLTALPTDLSEFMTALSDLARRLQPLGQMAESAGSLFGLRGFASLLGGTPPPPAPLPAISAAPCPAAKEGRSEEGRSEKGSGKEGGRKEGAAGQEGGCKEALTKRGLDQCLGMKGVGAMRPARAVPRTSTTIAVPTSVSGGMNARAMPWPSVGEKLPLVTIPTG